MTIEAVSDARQITKKSNEKTMRRRMLYNPKAVNKTFKKLFGELGWKAVKVR